MIDKLWQGNMKYVTLAVIIMLIVFAIGAFVITSFNGMIIARNIDYVDTVVTNKYISNDSDHYYVIVNQKGDLFDIINITDNDDIFSKIQVGQKYRFVTQKPYSVDDKYIHILQVHNGTS